MRNPKGIALIILGLIFEYSTTGDGELLTEATSLGDWLLSQQSDPEAWGEAAWGYHFDWQARAFYVPKGKPNIITTVYVALAMDALARVTGVDRFACMVTHAADFIISHLFVDDTVNPYFRYIPGESALVHNASLWGAALVAQAGASSNNAEWLDCARRACLTSVKAQNDRGAWPYGGRGHHSFVDSFHTGFNLEALHRYSIATLSNEFQEIIEKGLTYYQNNMFLTDGTPKYYDNQVYPIDMHTTAQAVITLLKVGGTVSDIKLAKLILDWSIENMYDKDSGFFYYQKNKQWNNRIVYLRWTQAWMYYALSYFLSFCQKKDLPSGQ